MAAPESYAELGLVGYTHEGSYSETATYNRFNCVEYEGSTYVALLDNLTGVTPSNDGTSWQYLARGFQREDAKHVTIIDKDNYVGSGAGTEVVMQDWADKVSDDLQTVDKTIGSADYSALASTITEGLKILQTFKGTTDITGKAIPTASEMISLLQGIGEASKLGTSGFHNGIYRGKYLGSSVTSDQWAAIKAGTFIDLYIGDYWIINGITWRIAAFDYYLHAGDTECTVHHVVIVPDTCLYSAQFETSNTTKNGYYGSQLKQSGLDSALATAASAFGSDHILEHRNYFCNACSTDTGRPSAGAWYSTKIDIMTEEMVYGTREFAAVNPGQSDIWSGFHNYNIDYTQLPLFALDKSKICNRSWYWLRNPVSPASFAYVGGDGNADYNNASDSGGVRPSFAIYQA